MCEGARVFARENIRNALPEVTRKLNIAAAAAAAAGSTFVLVDSLALFLLSDTAKYV